MSLSTIIEGLGLNANEAKIYLATLSLDEGTAAEIAKKAQMKRPSAYVVLKQLTRKGIISSYMRRKVTRFVALEPQRLIAQANERTEQARTSLPELEALSSKRAQGKPRVEFFEGREGMIQIMEDTLQAPETEILGYIDASLAWDTLVDYYPLYIEKKNARKIVPRAIVIDNEQGRRFKDSSLEEKRIARLVPGDQYPISNEVAIYGDRVSIISHKDQVGVIVKSAEIAQTQRAIFKLAWERAKEIDPDPCPYERRK